MMIERKATAIEERSINTDYSLINPKISQSIYKSSEDRFQNMS